LGTITPKIDFCSELGGLFDISGKVAYVPGGYGGIGEAITWGLALRGAKVVIGGRSAEKANALAQRILDQGYEALGISVDVRSVIEITRSADYINDQFGSIDILINCVGIGSPILKPMLEMTEETFDKAYESNLKSAMFLAQAVAGHQVAAKKGGKQVHILSVRSKLGLRGRGYSAYCSTKGGLLMLVKQHAMELAPYGINVNGVAPTFVYTEMIDHVLKDPQFRDKVIGRIPLGRIANPKDIVGPVLFLCSPAADFITGQAIFVDGGITASP
jgi:NAD(P)-dependent dehydrogenase (short-subunit alcohol dehydrogenase family)